MIKLFTFLFISLLSITLLKAMPSATFPDQHLKPPIANATLNAVRSIRFINRLDSDSVKKVKPQKPADKGKNKQPSLATVTIKGRVADANGHAMTGATVTLKVETSKAGKFLSVAGISNSLVKADNQRITTTNDKGEYSFIDIPNDKFKLTISTIGYARQEKVFKPTEKVTTINASMVYQENAIGEVVVNGIYSRPKANYTGAATSFTGDELREINPTNILEGLRTLDASFQAPVNDINGSNPNVIDPKTHQVVAPAFQVRGTNSIAQTDLTSEYGYISNPPLIIVDRIETSVADFLNLDINRIARITILKDAAATAIYGAKSANGVLVIDTKKPKPGETNIRYTGGVTYNTPDLSTFNLMNSTQKFAFEQIAGVYKSSNAATQRQLDDKYNLVLHNVKAGINTDWIKLPIHDQLNDNHSFSAQIGTKKFQYEVDLNYLHNGGLMIGSKNDSYGGGISANYKSGKLTSNTQFKLSGTNNAGSPYGDFSNYATLNPYWTPYNADGSIAKYADSYAVNSGVSLPSGLTPNVINPLYDATLNTFLRNTSFDMQVNNFSEYAFTPDLKLNGTFSYQSGNTGYNNFVPGNSSAFFGVDDFTKRGFYDKTTSTGNSYTASVNIDYGKIIGKSTVYATVGAKQDQSQGENLDINVIGYPSDQQDDILLGLQYNATKPSGSFSIQRNRTFYGNASYAYDNRFLLDLTENHAGSSVFGASSRYADAWAIGTGWNVDKEKWFKITNVIDKFKIRGSYGYTGSVNFPTAAALTTYTYNVQNRYLNFSPASVEQIGNPDLRYQLTKKLNLGTDISFFKGKMLLGINYFDEITTGLITPIHSLPSTGYPTYQGNLGETENIGAEVSLTAFIFKEPERQLFWSVSTTWFHNQNKVRKIGDALKDVDQAAQAALAALVAADPNKRTSTPVPVLQYVEGQSVSELYAVRSLGIDPATGYEVYLTKDGKQTYTWNVKDQVPIGDLQPKFNMTLNNHFQYKWFKISFGIHMELGGVQYNTSEADALENADATRNVSVNILNGRWLTQGQIANYRSLTNPDGYPRIFQTPITSRFVHKNNTIELTGLSIDPGALLSNYINNSINRITNAAVNKLNDQTKKAVKTNMVDFKFYMNNVVSFHSLDKERGTSYPLNRTYSVVLTVNL